MNGQIAKIVALTAPVGLAMGLTGCQSMSSEDEQGSTQTHPAIIVPDYKLDDRVAKIGQSVSFGIAGEFTSDNHHRWFFNGSPIDAYSARELGVTGYESPHLVIKSADLVNCGFYSYQNELLRKDGRVEQKFSATSQLWVARVEAATKAPQNAELKMATAALQTVVVVYGTVISAPGHTGTCPGQYVSYARYPARYFGKGGLASDGNNGGNAVVFTGTPFTNTGCGVNNVNVPTIPCNYTFGIFFKSQPSAAPYPLKLTIN